MRQSRDTLAYLIRKKPRLVVTQNPSLVLAMFVLVWRSLQRNAIRVVVDAHNEAVEPIMHTGWIFQRLSRWVIRAADYTVVTNRFLADKVVTMGGRPLVLPDPLPDVPPGAIRLFEKSDTLTFLVVATYAKDEPIEQILEAARRVGGKFEFLFTGNYRKLPTQMIAGAPANAKFLGFLSDNDYWRAMQHAHAVIDLTTLDDCLVCGAYEAIAAGRPQILSRTRALMEYFRKGAVFCDADAAAIIKACTDVRTRYDQLVRELVGFDRELKRDWESMAGVMMTTITTA
jgi:hypothetical protein